MQDVEIEFVYPHSPTARFIRKLLMVLLSEGAEYNSGKYAGEYLIIPDDYSDQIQEKETASRERTEKLEDIIEEYSQFDPNTTRISISLNHFGADYETPFTLRIAPAGKNHSKVSFWIASKEITSNDHFHSIVKLCSTTFGQFDFQYGKLKSEYEEDIPTIEEEIQQEPFGEVTFYSKELAEDLELEQLRLAHVYHFERLENGGVIVVFSTIYRDNTKQLSGGGRLERANKAMGFL